jgi:hypothetical protein
MTSERIVNIFEHVTTSAPVFMATVEDFGVPELRPLLDIYGRGKGVDALYRHSCAGSRSADDNCSTSDCIRVRPKYSSAPRISAMIRARELRW